MSGPLVDPKRDAHVFLAGDGASVDSEEVRGSFIRGASALSVLLAAEPAATAVAEGEGATSSMTPEGDLVFCDTEVIEDWGEPGGGVWGAVEVAGVVIVVADEPRLF